MTRSTAFAWVAVSLVASGVWSCGDNKSTSPGPPTETAIGPTGGSAASQDGKATVVVPPGATSATVNVTIAEAASFPQGAVSAVYDLGPDGTQFGLPVEITIQYDPAGIPTGVAESELWMAKVVGNGWEEVPGSTVNTNANTVSASIQSFSEYGVVAPEPSGNGSGNVTDADFAAWGTITSILDDDGQTHTAVVANVQKNNGTADVSNWPGVLASEAKLIGTREITLTNPFGTMYVLPEGEVLAVGESYKLRLTVEQRTFTTKEAGLVLGVPRITTEDGQQIDVGTSFTVRWNAVSNATAYSVVVGPVGTSAERDTVFFPGTATQQVVPGEVFAIDDDYNIVVSAYDRAIGLESERDEDFLVVYGFDDPKMLGGLFSVSSDHITVEVGEGGGNGGNGQIPGELVITVSSGTTPAFSWTGGMAQNLMVMEHESENSVWGILSTAGFPSPVTYGQLPAGAMEMVPASPLVRGTTYEVVILGLGFTSVGSKTFTP